MGLMDLIDKARELFSGGGLEGLTDKAGELSDIAQGDGSVLEKAQEALDGLDDGGDADGAAADGPGASKG
jgi:hypothetical protein